MMKSTIALITPPTESHRTAEETLALGYLSAVLSEADYNTVVIDGWLENLTKEEIVERLKSGPRPSIVGVSAYRSSLSRTSQLKRKLKKEFGDIQFVCGGYGPTFHWKDFLEEGFDVAVIGEAEHMIVELVSHMLTDHNISTVKGIAYKEGGVVVVNTPSDEPVNLESLPFPTNANIEVTRRNNNYKHVCTSRGCLAHCSFCSIFSFALKHSRTSRWRERSVESIVNEIEELNKEFGISHFKFVDDSFIEPPRDEEWSKRFRNALEERKLDIRFRTQIRADRITEGIVRNLKEAGWFSTSIGIENGSDTALRRMHKLANSADNKRALQVLESNNIYVQMGMILFDPLTTIDELSENFEFLSSNPWPVTKGIFTEMFAAEGTVFSKRLNRKETFMQEKDDQNRYYSVIDERANRVYQMLKMWHKSHAFLYNWVIDSISAPKILPDEGYMEVHQTYQILRKLDLDFFEKTLYLVTRTLRNHEDVSTTSHEINSVKEQLQIVESRISNIYRTHGLTYSAIQNPYL